MWQWHLKLGLDLTLTFIMMNFDMYNIAEGQGQSNNQIIIKI